MFFSSPRFVASLLLLFSIMSDAEARSFRVNMIPNGRVFSCANCHFNPGGGGARNAFGQDVFEMVGGGSATPFWSATLAAIDSDGDGATNGEELGDPDGDGTPIPGATVTNPGDPRSRPPENAAPTVQITQPASGSTFNAPATVTLVASAQDSDGSIARVEFFNGLDSLGAATAAPYQLTVTLQAGSYQITAVATDHQGATTRSAPIDFTVSLPSPILITTITRTGGQVSLAWTGGVGPFSIQANSSLDPGEWTELLTSQERRAISAAPDPLRYYRIRDLGQ